MGLDRVVFDASCKARRKWSLFVLALAALLWVGPPGYCQILAPGGVSQNTPLPAVQIGHLDSLISPSAASSYFLSAIGTPPTSDTPDPLIAGLAQSLENDPGKIYDYVYNNVRFLPLFGLQRGARGAIIDGYGTAFDQAQLTVQLLRASGYQASYEFGTATVSGATFAAWFGITDATVATSVLADGGFAATVSPASGPIAQVQMLHVWVKYSAGASTYYIDPSVKSMTQVAGINLASTMGYGPAGFVAAAQQGSTQTTGVANPTVRGISDANIRSALTAYATQLQYYMTANPNARLEDIVGGLVPSSTAIHTAPASLPYSGALLQEWPGQIPNALRTALTITLTPTGTSAGWAQSYFLDYLYGKNVGISGGFTGDPNGGGGAVFCAVGAGPTAEIFVEGDALLSQSFSGTSCLPSFNVQIDVNHPYAAAGGNYMDRSITRPNMNLSSPAMLVLGGGMSTQNVNDWMARRRWQNSFITQYALSSCSGGIQQAKTSKTSTGTATTTQTSTPSSTSQTLAASGTTCPTKIPDLDNGEKTKQSIATTWLVENSRMMDLAAKISQTVVQQHDVVGFAYYASAANGVGDVVQTQLFLDVEQAFSVNTAIASDSGAANRRVAAMHVIASASAVLEGQASQEVSPDPSIASAPTRIAWANVNSPNAFGRYNRANPGSLVDNYISSGYTEINLATTVAPGQGLLGPGYPVCPGAFVATSGSPVTAPWSGSNAGNCPGQSVWATAGNGFLAFGQTTYANGQTVTTDRIAYITTDPLGIAKGASGASEDPTVSMLDSSDASSDFVRKQAENYGLKPQVDLRTGELTLSTGPDLTVGSGSFPFMLSFERTYKSGYDHSPGLTAGWRHNLDIEAKLSGSGMEAMGWTEPRNASVSIAYLYTVFNQFINYGLEVESVGPGNDPSGVVPSTTYIGISVTNAVIASSAGGWWYDQMGQNVVSIREGAGATTFVRQADSSFAHPAGAGDTLFQSGLRTIAPGTKFVPYFNYSDITFTRIRAHGDSQTFSYQWNNSSYDGNVVPTPPGTNCPRDGADPTIGAECNPAKLDGFYISNWTWPAGMQLSFSYGGVGLLSSVANNLGRSMSFAYSVTNASATDQVASLLTSVTENSSSRSASYGYTMLFDNDTDAQTLDFQGDARQLLTSVTGPDGYTTNYHYMTQDAVPGSSAYYANFRFGHRLTQVTLPASSGPTLTINWDGNDYRVSSTVDADNVTHIYWPNLFRGRHVMAASQLSNATWYDDHGRPTRSIAPDGGETDTTYDPRGRVVLTTQPELNSTAYTYDDASNQLTVTRNPKPGSSLAATTMTATYILKWNKPVSVQNYGGISTFYSYSSTTGTLSTITQPSVVYGTTTAVPVTTYTYDSFGRVTKKVDADSSATTYVYAKFPANETMSSVTVDSGDLNLTTSFQWTPAGDLSQVTDPRGYITSATYDKARRRLSMTGPADTGALACWTYNANGWITSILRRQTTATSATTCPQPASSGSPANFQQWSYGYSNAGRLQTIADPQNFVQTDTYDPDGRPSSHTIPIGTAQAASWTTQYTYIPPGTPGAGKKYQVIGASGSAQQQASETYSYNLNGTVASLTGPPNAPQPNIFYSYVYDGFDRLSQVNYSDGRNEQYLYDRNDNRTSWTRTNGVTFTYTYDVLNRMTGRSGTSTVAAATWGYDLVGRKTLASAGGVYGLVEVYAYDWAGRLVSSTIRNNASGSTLTLGFAYDASGNRTQVTNSPGGAVTSYTYDSLNRVTTMNVPQGNLGTYSYDTASEPWVWRYANGETHTFTHNASGWLTNLAMSGPVTLTIGYGYDQSGHVTSETYSAPGYEWTPTAGADSAPSTGWTYSFDDLGRMISSANSAAGVSAAYTVDADGTRLIKTVTAGGTKTTTSYVTVGGQTWAEYDGASNFQRRFIYGLGNQVMAMQDTSNIPIYLHQDKRGSTIATSTTSGSVLQTYKYDAYGLPSATTIVPFLYTGHRYDAETGLYFTPARSYDPVAGEWISADPIGTKDGVNAFLYVHGDPIDLTDPSGTVAGVDDAAEATVAVGFLGAAAIGGGYHYWATTPDGQHTLNGLGNGISSGFNRGIQQLKNIAQSDNAGKEGGEKGRKAGSDNAPKGTLPRDPKTGDYLPDPDAEGAHTTLGKRPGSNGGTYTQGATFDEDGEFQGRTDVTDHGRGDHPDPHFHPATGSNSVGGARPIGPGSVGEGSTGTRIPPTKPTEIKQDE